jgi:hypothetical protein
MAASSVTGVGQGSSNKPGVREFGIVNTGPSIILTGITTAAENIMLSPPSTTLGIVLFQQPLPKPSSEYVVLITPLNTTDPVYIGSLLDNEANQFYGFNVLSSSECDVMFMVADRGMKIIS